MGEQVNKTRGSINSLKAQIEQVRVSQAVHSLTERNGDAVVDVREEELRGHLEDEKSRFKQMVGDLRQLKTEIEHLQHLLEKAKVKMQKDFEIWWAEQGALIQPPSVVRQAWKTPPVTPASNDSIESARLPISAGIPLDLSHPGELSSPLCVVRPSSSHQRKQKVAMLDDNRRSSRTDIVRASRDSVMSNESTSHRLDRSSRGTVQTERKGSESSYLDSTVSSVSDLATKNSQDSNYSTSRHLGKGRSHQNRISNHPPSSVQLTGDSRADADILAFIKARQGLIQKGYKKH